MGEAHATDPVYNPARQFIRHAADIPIEVRALPGQAVRRQPTVNVSEGGLSFIHPEDIPIGSTIEVRIAAVSPPFEARARVVWTRAVEVGCWVGVQFLDASDAFRSRMVEQVCAIESYRRRVQVEEGRILTREEAAQEWISKFASRFPAA